MITLILKFTHNPLLYDTLSRLTHYHPNFPTPIAMDKNVRTDQSRVNSGIAPTISSVIVLTLLARAIPEIAHTQNHVFTAVPAVMKHGRDTALPCP